MKIIQGSTRILDDLHGEPIEDLKILIRIFKILARIFKDPDQDLCKTFHIRIFVRLSKIL